MRRFRRFVILVGVVLLASCDAPVGVAPAPPGTYGGNALVTNPNGGGPMVVRWGPPSNYNPSGHE